MKKAATTEVHIMENRAPSQTTELVFMIQISILKLTNLHNLIRGRFLHMEHRKRPAVLAHHPVLKQTSHMIVTL